MSGKEFPVARFNFVLFSLSERSEYCVASLPVPEVVGTAIKNIFSSGFSSILRRFSTEIPVPALTAAAFAASIALPPPRPIIASQLLLTAISAATSAVSTEGSSSTLSKTIVLIFINLRASITVFVKPNFSALDFPVTSKTFLQPGGRRLAIPARPPRAIKF